MIKKINKIFGLVLIFQIMFGSIAVAQTLTASKVKPNGLKPVPDVFRTYPKSKFITQINEGVKLVSSYMESTSELAWAVYSDRKDNEVFYDPFDNEVKARLPYMGRYFVDKVDGNWIHLVTVKTSGISGHKVDKNIGWIDAANLILSKYPVLSDNGAPKKKMVLMSASDFDQGQIDEEILEQFFNDRHYYNSPVVNDGNLVAKYKTVKQADKFKVLFVIKETASAVLLASSDKINQPSEVYGWIHQFKTTAWDTRVCLEPISGRKAQLIDKNPDRSSKSAFVFLNTYDLTSFFDMGQIKPRVTFLKEVKLKKRRMIGTEMRYPVMPWDNNGNARKKIAVIAQLGDSEDNGDGCDRECQRAKLRFQLDSINKLANVVNALIVIDGTSSMRRYGPVVARSIENIINERQIDGKQTMKWGLAIYRDYADGNRKFEIIPLNDDYRGVVEKLRNIDYSSKNPSHAEAHYYGMTEAIKRAGYVNGQSNIIVLVGDAGNHLNDKNNLTKESVIDLLAKKRINLISFQVNFLTGRAAPAYSKFSGDSKSYILSSAQSFLNKLKDSNGLDVRLNRGSMTNSYSLGFSGFKCENTQPLFGVFNHAIPGNSMSVSVFRNNLVNTFLDYMKSLDERTKILDCLITGDCGNIDECGKKVKKEIGPEFDGEPDDICRLLNLSPKICKLFIDQGQISISGYTHMKLGNDEVFNSVAYMSTTYKAKLDERLGELAYISGSGQKARDKFYKTLISLIKGLVGENTPEEEIKKWTFDETWEIILNIPFSNNSSLNTRQISDLLTENISSDEFEIFLENFKGQTEAFINFPRDKDLKYTEYPSGSQTFYWIPFSVIPRGEE
jgi:hypothetical protein